jgi:hypothetical protein
MPHDNAELTRQAYDAFNQRNWRAFAALMHQDVEVESRLVAMEGGYRGDDGLRRWRDGRCFWWRNCATEAEALAAMAERTGTTP